MKNDDLLVNAIVTAIGVAFVAVLIGISYFVKSKQCSAAWDGSGMASEYGYWSGCVLTLKDGRVIPADRYREVTP